MTPSGPAAAIAPEPAGSGPVATADDVTSWTDLRDWERQLSTAGGCSHPIRLTGRVEALNLVTGETAEVFKTWTDAVYNAGVGNPDLHDTYRDDHPLLIACGNRRESACPACSAIYKRDARQLVRSGLTGGKGIPATVADHPCVFATFTAPGFGPVHARRERNGQVLPCRPRRDASRRACPHGRVVSCPLRHPPDDPRLGRPMCPDCYDYQSAVLFNAYAGDLWRRFVTYLPRRLAWLAGITQKQLRSAIRIRFVKVAEYQSRGVVHFHAIIRLDANASDDTLRPPLPGWTATLLADAVTAAASAASVLADAGAGRTLLIRFGAQTDTRIIRRGAAGVLTQAAVANYIAKYATKTLEVKGLPGTRIRDERDLWSLRCHPHYRRMIEAAWDLGLTQWAHCLGFGGHFLTKSRRYSVTFGRLRAERIEHRKRERHPDGELDPWGRPVDETTVLYLGSWIYAGTGYVARSVGAELAAVSADMARGR